METKLIEPESPEITERSTAGCLMLLGSALFACFLLTLNGGIVIALIDGLRQTDASWIQSEQVAQFVVLIGPVLMLVLQWWLFDWLRSRFSRRPAAPHEPHHQ